MELHSRRGVLAGGVGGLVTLAGCSIGGGSSDSDTQQNFENEQNNEENLQNPDADGDGVPDSEDAYPNDSERSVRKVWLDNWRNIQEGGYVYWDGFTPDGQIHLKWQFLVRDGPAVDFLLLEESEFMAFKEGNRFRYLPTFSTPDSVGDRGSGWLQPGNYVLVIDNSNRASAQPPTNFDEDPAKVEYKTVISR